MSHPLIESSFAAARKRLDDARNAQWNALYFASLMYRAGSRGRTARKQSAVWDEKRTMHLNEALRIRSRIRQLRVELRRLELEHNSPPPRAA